MNDLAARCTGLLDAPTLAAFLTAHGNPIAAGTIRQWASNGLITRHGKDERGRTLYDVLEVGARALKKRAA